MRILSGIQPTNLLHIGNYFGAIAQWVDLAKTHEAYFCVVDLHAITVPQDPKTLSRHTLDLAKWYLAAGIDPQESTLFVQSWIPEHTELAWVLNTIAKVSELERMTQWKDKARRDERKNANAGLLTYPVLMAADILLYDTDLVPVGEDQEQHVELCRTLARRFNVQFGQTFKVPEVQMRKTGSRVMGLDDPEKKMSKSATSEYNYIALTDATELVRKKVMKAATDSGMDVRMRGDKPAIANLLTVFSLVSGRPVRDLEAEFGRRGYAPFKKALAEALIAFLTPLQKKFSAISDEEIMRVLKDGASRARAVASATLSRVRERVGFLRQTRTDADHTLTDAE